MFIYAFDLCTYRYINDIDTIVIAIVDFIYQYFYLACHLATFHLTTQY